VPWFVDGGLELARHRWLSMPEYVVYRLGGELVHEPSLASAPVCSTSPLADRGPTAPAELGLPPTLLPPVNHSVKASGRWRTPDYLTGCGRRLLVGGDHPVAAIGVGATGPRIAQLGGTADVVVRSLPAVLTDSSGNALSAAVSRSACMCCPVQVPSSAASWRLYCAACSACSVLHPRRSEKLDRATRMSEPCRPA
jgi:sugar (pentulose or hexulose) kinase